jgi:hypothetical protein
MCRALSKEWTGRKYFLFGGLALNCHAFTTAVIGDQMPDDWNPPGLNPGEID